MKSIISVKAFLDMLAWSEELITDVRKPEIMVMTSLWRRAYWLLRSPSQTCHAKPETQINRRRTLPASFRWWDAYHQRKRPERLLSKSRDAVALQQIRSVALPMIDRGDIDQAIDIAAISGLHCRALVVSSSIRLTAWLQNSKKRAERSEIDAGRVTAIISLWLSASSSACHGLLIITVITPLPTKPSATKMPENWSWRTRQLWHADASAWCCCARCKIHEGVSWC